MDILVEELGDFVSVVEIKNTNWNKIPLRRVKSYANRQIKQIWSYIDSQLRYFKLQVCPGVIFPHLPSSKEKLRVVEEAFNDSGVQVVWQNESIKDVKKRMKNTK